MLIAARFATAFSFFSSSGQSRQSLFLFLMIISLIYIDISNLKLDSQGFYLISFILHLYLLSPMLKFLMLDDIIITIHLLYPKHTRKSLRIITPALLL